MPSVGFQPIMWLKNHFTPGCSAGEGGGGGGLPQALIFCFPLPLLELGPQRAKQRSLAFRPLEVQMGGRRRQHFRSHFAVSLLLAAASGDVVVLAISFRLASHWMTP